MKIPNDVKDIHLLGDIHGDYAKHDRFAKKNHFTIQLGDFGFNFDSLKKHDPNYHKVLGGNHDNYDLIKDVPHYLGDYGTFELDTSPSPESTYPSSVIKIFYMRGAYSIDQYYRTIGIDWWPEEELELYAMVEAIYLYDQYKPDVVISHSPPSFVIPHLVPVKFNSSKTESCLDKMHELHKPALHIFGHMHVQKQVVLDGTKFLAVNINQTVSLMKYYGL